MSRLSTFLSRATAPILEFELVKQVLLLSAQARTYGAMFFWLLGDVFSHFRWRSLRVLLSGAVYLAGKFAAVGVMYYVINLLENKTQVSVFGFPLPSPESPALLAFGIGVMLVCLSVAAAFSFEVRRQCVAVGRQYDEFCSRRTFMLTSRLPHLEAGWAMQEVNSGRINSQLSYSRICGRVSAYLGEAIPALAGLAISSIILLVIDPGLTAVIGLLALLVFVAQYPVNRRAARINQALHANRSKSGRRLRGVLSRLRGAPVPLSMDSPVLERTFADGNVVAMLQSIASRRRVRAEGKLVAELGSGLILAAVLLIVGGGIVEGSRSWSEAVVYFAALRFALRDFSKSISIPITINRFYTEMSRLHAFVTSASKALEAPTNVPARPFDRVSFDLPALQAATEPLTLEAGAVLAALAPRKAGLAVAGLLFEVQKVPSGEAPRPVVLVDCVLLDPQIPLRTSLALPQSTGASDLAASLAAFAPEGESQDWATPDWLDREPKAPWDTVLPVWALYALAALAALERGHRLIMIKASVFDEMDTRWREALKACLADGLLILAHNRVEKIGPNGESAVILCDIEAAREWSLVDDTEATRSLLAEAYARISEAAALQAGEAVDRGVVDDDEEDEELDFDLL